VDLRIVRIVTEDFPVVRRRFLVAPGVQQEIGEIEVGVGKARVELQGALETRSSFVGPSDEIEGRAEVVVESGAVRPGREGLLILRDRCILLARLLKNISQLVVHLRVIRFEP
jgi:hypothetical protein